MSHTSSQVLHRLNKVLDHLTVCIKENKPPTLSSPATTTTTTTGKKKNRKNNNKSSSNSSSFPTKSLTNISQCRSFTSIILVLSFVQKLLLSNRTTTNREVYYFFVTYFRSQRECDAAISDVCTLLSTERISLGLTASPKGWFCGEIQITREQHIMDGRAISSIQGLPITREWIHRAAHILHEGEHQHQQKDMEELESSSSSSSLSESKSKSKSKSKSDSCSNCDDQSDANSCSSGDSSHASSTCTFQIHPEAQFQIHSSALAIIVIEKEGVYARLSEDKFYTRIPTILITSKGVPDIATRAMVYCLWKTLHIPVYGLADCNPYGLGVLQTFFKGGKGNGRHNKELYQVPMQWIGLRPSQLQEMEIGRRLPKEVFQKLTGMDMRKLKGLEELGREQEREQVEEGGNAFVSVNEVRGLEIQLMRENGWKVELESLHWLGMEFMSDWLEDVLGANLKYNYREQEDGASGEERGVLTESHGFEGDFHCDQDEEDAVPRYDPRIAC